MSEHVLINSIAKLREGNLLIYGTGAFADRLYAWLTQEEKVAVSGFLLDGQYCGNQKHLGLPIHPIELYLPECPKNTIVLVSFVNYDIRRFFPYKDCAELICCDIQGLFVLGPFDYLDRNYLLKHSAELTWLERNLEDNVSRQHLSLFLEQKITGIYGTEYEPCQYYPRDFVNLGNKEVFIDCGAYDGDSVKAFIYALGERGITGYQKIIAFEPDKENQEKFRQNTEHLSNIKLVLGGVWSDNDILRFQEEAGASSAFDDSGETEVPVYAIDDILQGERTTYIKMDVEGSELEALKGAQRTIRKWRPKLAVCVYHKKEDLFTIPQYIKSLVPDYRLYLRKHSPAALEVVIYAI